MKASRNEVWLINLNPTKGHEQSGRRPCLVISSDSLNHSPAELVIVLPITSKDKGIPSHVPIEPPEGGLTLRSYIKTEDIRSVSTERLEKRLGAVTNSTMNSVEKILGYLLF
jgi:mRNA interferase MazF